MIFQNDDAAGLGVFQAALEGLRALVIGANADQNAVAPAVVLGSAVIDLPRAFLRVARAVRDREPRPGVFTLGAEVGVTRFIIDPALRERIAPSALASLDSTWMPMTRGTWRSPLAAPGPGM